jgi:hypothetical protein
MLVGDWLFGCIACALSMGAFAYFCALYGRSFVFSKARLVTLALACALFFAPLCWMPCVVEDISPPLSSGLVALAYGFLFGVFALGVACQRGKSAVGRALSRYLRCEPRRATSESRTGAMTGS